MKGNLTYLILALVLTGCSSFLDVKPKDQLLDERVFANEETILLAKQGIYSQLASSRLYGGALTMGDVDVLAQYYQCPTGHLMNSLSRYQYNDRYVDTTFAGIWKAAYSAILNINSFIHKLEPAERLLDEGMKNQLLGECYGLRALVHFDLLRIFGPVFQVAADAEAIPYNSSPSPLFSDILSASAIGDSILRDLEHAVGLLADDPIRNELSQQPQHNERFNYFSALALSARVHLYIGEKERALLLANQVISEGSEIFRWALDNGIQEVDKHLSTELIFKLGHPDMERQYRRFFSPTQVIQSVLFPSNKRLLEIYDTNVTDPRWGLNWSKAPSEDSQRDVFAKYAPPVISIPMMRISEMYLIAAECEPDVEKGVALLNTLRSHRNEFPLDGNMDLDGTLFNAYRKEFWGEGQLFFFMKRTFRQSIPDGSNDGSSIQMVSLDYQLPIPKAELIYR